MNTETMLQNKTISENLLELAKPHEDKNDEFIIAIQCDLHENGNYGESAIFLSKKKIVYVEDSKENHFCSLDFSDIDLIKVKRLYGNAIMIASLKDGKNVQVARFTFSAAILCESACEFIKRINKGMDFDDAYDGIKNSFINQGSYCPKCGFRLSTPGAPCKNCGNKLKLGSTILKFIKPHTGKLVLSLFLAVLTTAASLIPPLITQTLVDDVVPNPDKSAAMSGLVIIIVCYILLHLVNSAIGVFKTFVLRRTGNLIIGDLKKEIYQKAQYLPMKYYDKTSTGSVVTRINSDTVTLQSFMMNTTQNAIVNILTVIGIIIVMLVMNWKLTLLALIPVPFIVWLSTTLSEKIKPFYRRIWRRNMTLSTILTDTIPSIRVVKSFSREESTNEKFSDVVDSWLYEDKKLGHLAALLSGFIGFLVMLGTGIIWFVGGRTVILSPDELSLGTLVSFISYTSMFYGPINFFATLADSYQAARASAERVMDILNAEPEHNFGKGKKLERVRGKIEFRNINFAFDRSKKVLNNVNFVIEPGEVVGIVGTTGSGKSTLINLLMRFYDDYDGDIFLDDINVKEIDMEYFRDQIGYVQQEPIMFRDTIFNNIAYSKPGATADEVINVADIANAHGFISRLPDSYDTVLGERGVGLSGGEKQRLSIARAVLKNPSILIFDEATSAVDSETEKLIQDAIDNIVYGRTTLMIAHRLSTLRKANKIIVVDQGNIIEFGTPEELMALKGKFYKLVNIQSMSEQAEADKRAENLE